MSDDWKRWIEETINAVKIIQQEQADSVATNARLKAAFRDVFMKTLESVATSYNVNLSSVGLKLSVTTGESRSEISLTQGSPAFIIDIPASNAVSRVNYSPLVLYFHSENSSVLTEIGEDGPRKFLVEEFSKEDASRLISDYVCYSVKGR